MMNTSRTFIVPGEGLKIEVAISAEEIVIIPCIDRNGDKINEFAQIIYRTRYTFKPEAYKRFWRWISKSDEEAYVRHGERMRAALNFALRKYRAKYGEIFN
jgi:hypothetical protein